ncbi:hypothetical protein T265_01871 [Opisthorchis viverrini]|uniref:Clc-like protein n=1 Tax=Opisthorchis viverrini TaxID=6198 RepID=A0A075A886_OPIVI|nr:hypothetical protein T265_01871 [Opisthorchis viverrini]KER31935.1 hypothetical protein T265_01871 [Opisthorchis viverrini]
MEIEEFMFQRPKYTLLYCGISVILLGSLAVGTTIGAISWQEIVVYEPDCPLLLNNKFLCQRRSEGLFRICPQTAATENYRLSTSVVFIVALFLAAVATVLAGVFVHFWMNAAEDSTHLLVFRIIVALLFVVSGIFYQAALILLHYTMVQEKTLFTPDQSEIFTSWSQAIQETTNIRYSVSYALFWTALAAVYVASIVLFCGSVSASQYHASYKGSSTELFDRECEDALGYFGYCSV